MHGKKCRHRIGIQGDTERKNSSRFGVERIRKAITEWRLPRSSGGKKGQFCRGSRRVDNRTMSISSKPEGRREIASLRLAKYEKKLHQPQRWDIAENMPIPF